MKAQTPEYKGYEYWRYRVDLASRLLKKFNGEHAKVLVYIDDHCPSISIAEIDELLGQDEKNQQRS